MIRTPFGNQTPPGAAPSLARLAHNRLAFGPRPEDAAGFNSFNFANWLDEQLAPETIDDSACDASIAGIDRNHSVDGQAFVLPPPEATLAELAAYDNDLETRVNNRSQGYLQLHLFSVTYARALLSKRQLNELMVDFWTNHLHTNFERSSKYWEDQYVIRQHALGNFRDLIGASAKSPSMLHFLSNTYSDASGPNENYGRELMELHTMGSYSWVPGAGYRTQANYNEDDVHTVAQAFTGWTTLRSPNDAFGFNEGQNYPRHHWFEKRLWLGNDDRYLIPFGGADQGEQIIDILCEHPSTAYRLAHKLAVRFICDSPEQFCPGAIEAAAQAFLSSHGDIRSTVRALLTHIDAGNGDFAHSWGQKVKRPFEFFASSMRAMGLNSVPFNFLTEGYNSLAGRDILNLLDGLGQRLFDLGIPTGYNDIGVSWWTSNQVFGRWTLANALTNRFFGPQTTTAIAPVNAALDTFIGNVAGGRAAGEVVDALISNFVGRMLDPADRTALVAHLGGGAAPASALITSAHPRLRSTIGLLAASPYAQWR